MRDEFEELSTGLLEQLPVMQSPRELPVDSACFPSADDQGAIISKHDPADISGTSSAQALDTLCHASSRSHLITSRS
jgi:hypothetical protein